MDSGLYAAYTGLMARTQALDTAANNLANAGATGYRAQRDYFRGVLAQVANDTPESQVGNSINDYGVLGGTRLDEGQGTINKTGNPLDVAINGAGFFAVQTAQGVEYTRDGGFTRASDGTLETMRGEPVLDASGKTITLPTGAVTVGADGSVSVAAADGTSAIAGAIGVYDFAGSQPVALGANRYAAPDGVQPTAVASTVEQGALEGANLDAVQGTMELVLVQRQAEMMQKALSVFNNDFDKTAAEDLGRV